MTTIAKTVSVLPFSAAQGWSVSWQGMASGDDGAPYEGSLSSDRSVQVSGTFGAGGTLVIEGSNDGVNYVTLTDLLGNLLSFQTSNLEAITEVVRYIRPRVSAGDVNTDLDVTLVAVGQVKG